MPGERHPPPLRMSRMKRRRSPDLDPAAWFHECSKNRAYHARNRMAGRIHHDPFILELVRTGSELRPWRKGVSLPAPSRLPMPLDQALEARRSCRAFATGELSLERLSDLLHHAYGRTAEGRRRTPTSGGLASISLLLWARRVARLEPAVYAFRSTDHSLVRIASPPAGDDFLEHALYQRELAAAPVLVVLVSAVDRLKAKYGARGYRYALLDAGHVSQNLYLVATALGLGCCAFGAFSDDEVQLASDVDDRVEAALLMHALGEPAM